MGSSGDGEISSFCFNDISVVTSNKRLTARQQKPRDSTENKICFYNFTLFIVKCKIVLNN